MTSTAEPPRTDRRLGALESVVAKWFTRSAHVADVRTVAEGFRRVALAGDALRGAAWTPGQKVQLLLGGWVQRTFTPLSWDTTHGTTELLVYLHGASPASEWANALAPGQPCAVFGPRGSLDLNTLDRPGLLFGDETSIGLAHALRYTRAGASGVELVLEVSSLAAARAALDAVGVEGAHLIERRPDDAHASDVEAHVTRLRDERGIQGWVLSGNAPSILRLSKLLRRLGVPRGRIQTKAYWAPGKVGLD